MRAVGDLFCSLGQEFASSYMPKGNLGNKVWLSMVLGILLLLLLLLLQLLLQPPVLWILQMPPFFLPLLSSRKKKDPLCLLLLLHTHTHTHRRNVKSSRGRGMTKKNHLLHERRRGFNISSSSRREEEKLGQKNEQKRGCFF